MQYRPRNGLSHSPTAEAGKCRYFNDASLQSRQEEFAPAAQAEGHAPDLPDDAAPDERAARWADEMLLRIEQDIKEEDIDLWLGLHALYRRISDQIGELGMEVEAVTEVLGALSAKQVREHTQIAVVGQTANTLYLIVSGQAHLESKTEAYDLEPGDVFGQESLEVGATFDSTVTARSELRLLLLSGDDLRRLGRKYPLLAQRLESKVAW